MTIRRATKQDAQSIAEHLFLAMEDFVFEFIGEKDSTKAVSFLKHFIEKKNNQFSYENCYVAELENEIVGSVCIYDGANLYELTAPIIQYVRKHTNPLFNPGDETQAGEFYIDSFGVSPIHRGKGIGSKILLYLIEEYVNQRKKNLGLLVEESNPNAKKLYLKIGFKPVGLKILSGKRLEHLQILAG